MTLQRGAPPTPLVALVEMLEEEAYVKPYTKTIRGSVLTSLPIKLELRKATRDCRVPGGESRGLRREDLKTDNWNKKMRRDKVERK